jgi:hypothetical protein
LKTYKILIARPYIGSDAILENVFAHVGANYEHFVLKDVKIQGMNDNMVLATLRYDAKVKATGKSYNAKAAHFCELND